MTTTPAAAAATTDVDTGAELVAAFQAAAEDERNVVRLTAGITIDSAGPAIQVPDGRSVTLDLHGQRLTVAGAEGRAGIGVPETAELVIQDSDGNGSVVASGGEYSAGIGGWADSPTGGNAATGGTVIINGGTVNVGGGVGGAGIGGGMAGHGGTITINGGTVLSSAGDGAAIGDGASADEGGSVTINGGTITAGTRDDGNGAAIGGGYGRGAGTVTINGGTVEATSRGFGAGIGGGTAAFIGEEAADGTITINGGTVRAASTYAAGIGGGAGGRGGTIRIKDGTVSASGGLHAAGIGAGNTGDAGKIAIDGGTVTTVGGGHGAGIGAGEGGDGGEVTIGEAAVVSAASEDGSAVGGQIGRFQAQVKFGTLQNAGTLNLPFGVLNLPETAALINPGVITGPGSITGAGTIENTGAIRNTVKIADTIVVLRNNYLLTFDPRGGTGDVPEAFRVYAITLEAAGYKLPTETPTRADHTFVGWYPATDRSGAKLSASATLGQVNGPANAPYYAAWESNAPTLTGPETATFTVGQDGTYTPTVTGKPDPTVTATGLPDGLKIDQESGVITGVPAAGTEGSHQVILTATNGIEPDATLTLSLEIKPEPITSFDLKASPAEARVGDQLTVTGSGLPEGTKVALQLASDAVDLGTATANADGTFEFTATVPPGVEPGDHQVVAVVTIDGRAVTEKAPLRILAAAEPTPDDDADPDGSADDDSTDDHDATADHDADDGSLPNTGTDLPLGLLIGAGILLLAGSCTALIGGLGRNRTR